MSPLTPLERAALEAILDEQTVWRSALAEQLKGAQAASRNNTGGGFYTDLVLASDVHVSDEEFAAFGKNVWISVEGLAFGLGMILHTRSGQASFLEGYAVGADDTSAIDFKNVRFALAPEPGPLRADN